VLGQVFDWLYAKIVEGLSAFFGMMGNMGAELFSMDWVAAIVLFFSYLGWSLYVIGLVVSAFECGIAYQSGRGRVSTTAVNAIKGFLAAGLFSTVPVELYKLAVSLQVQFGSAITGIGSGIDVQAAEALVSLGDLTLGPGLGLFCVILMGYSVIKVFFANLKRGGILLIMIAVGSLHLFAVPRGYGDGFTQWCKQVIGLCLTAFLQATILTAGLMVLRENMLLGLGLMLAAGEVPRIAGTFGLDTTTRGNLMSAVYTAQAAVNVTRTVVNTITK